MSQFRSALAQTAKQLSCLLPMGLGHVWLVVYTTFYSVFDFMFVHQLLMEYGTAYHSSKLFKTVCVCAVTAIITALNDRLVPGQYSSFILYVMQICRTKKNECRVHPCPCYWLTAILILCKCTHISTQCHRSQVVQREDRKGGEGRSIGPSYVDLYDRFIRWANLRLSAKVISKFRMLLKVAINGVHALVDDLFTMTITYI